MDLTLHTTDDRDRWQLVDLLGRPCGKVVRYCGTFTVAPAGSACEPLKAVGRGPFPSLDATLAEIEKHIRGTCHAKSIPADNLNAAKDE
jgi:hypothetical protein